MKITIITVVYNAEKYIKDCIESVLHQDYKNIEYIIIDGESTDGTLLIIQNYRSAIQHLISEKDNGIYDAINKGIALATGEVIGILNADDCLASNTVITAIANSFNSTNVEGVYGNLNYVNGSDINHIVRRWISKQFIKKDIELGWMPAHPTLYLRKTLFEKYGYYSHEYGTAADYELILRFLYQNNVKAIFLNQLIVQMRIGGISNVSFYERYKAMINDWKAIKSNQISFPFITLLLKKLSKISQYIA